MAGSNLPIIVSTSLFIGGAVRGEVGHFAGVGIALVAERTGLNCTFFTIVIYSNSAIMNPAYRSSSNGAGLLRKATSSAVSRR
jgi:hypothetical protein